MSEKPDQRQEDAPHHLRVFDKVPRRLRRPARIAAGILLISGGMLGFLPILGFWMIPLGLSILAVDFPPAARLMEQVREVARRIWRQAKRGRRD